MCVNGDVIIFGLFNVVCGGSYIGFLGVVEMVEVGFCDMFVLDYFYLVMLVVMDWLDCEKCVDWLIFWFLILVGFVKVMGFIDCGEIVVGKCVDLVMVEWFKV